MNQFACFLLVSKTPSVAVAECSCCLFFVFFDISGATTNYLNHLLICQVFSQLIVSGTSEICGKSCLEISRFVVKTFITI